MTSGFTKALVIGALSTLGTLAWSGCGPGSEERYYCDNGGCFSCDAYGCSSVRPPKKTTCTSNASCKTGICTTAGCAETCSSDDNCPRGNTCQSGLCAEPGNPPVPIPDADAGPAPTDAGPAPTECTATSCTDGKVCVSGVCTSPENTCKFSSECEGDKVCAEGACLDPCSPTGTCASGYTCEQNVCQPQQPTPGDGGTGPVTCTGETCGPGNYCNNGVCAVDNRPKPNCTEDTTCGGTTATPKKCLGGFCKFTCTSDQHCRTIDSRIGYCAKDGVCRSATEAAAACTGPGTCPDGKSCIDNQCK
ncbi:MAG: hypothetical protein KIT84_17010 [Labilithrix sp.]|nr:hypothetical protein [Labilithrix sp.]MCW5812730.1 hypothetical protein [Labilithrix sp.]